MRRSDDDGEEELEFAHARLEREVREGRDVENFVAELVPLFGAMRTHDRGCGGEVGPAVEELAVERVAFGELWWWGR